MKQAFTHLKGLLLVFLFYGVVSQSVHAQAVSEIVTDYQGYWRSGVGNINPVKPMNSHNLISFSFNGQRYSTGVNDALLIANDLEFSAQDFHALPMQYFTGTPQSGTYIGLGQLYDGVDNGPGNPAPVNNIPMYLMDGIKGLDIGTCVANIPTGLISFGINSIFEPNIGDGIPDILITQIAQPGGANDQYAFRDSDGNVVGNTVNIVLDNITPVGNWVADFYSVVHNPMIITPGFVNTERQLRLWAADLSDFGVTPQNFSQITSFTVRLQGSSDIAFIAYNYETVEVTPLPAGIAVQKDGVYRDANENCVVDAGDVIDYTFKVINTGQAILNNVTVTDPMIEVIGAPISLAPGASNQTNFSGTYFLTAEDILAGVVYNQATVTGTNPQNEAVTSASVDPTPISNNSPFYDASCPTCTVTVLPTPLSITIPGNAQLEGCGVSVLNPLAFSTQPASISVAQFTAAGGSIANPGMITGISYVDVASGTCTVEVTRTFTLTTACDTFTYTQTISISDTTPPVVETPQAVTIEGCGNMFPAPDTSIIVASDNCSDVTVSFTSESTPVQNGCSETITRIYTVTDACGLSTTVEHELTRTMDLEAPVASNPSDIVIVGVNQPLPDPDTSVVTGATDNCGEVTVAFVSDADPAGTCEVTVVRTYSVTDACGNVTQVHQNIIRTIDTTAPVADIQDIVSPCGLTVPAPTATDDCSGAITGTTTDPVTFTEAGTYTINWTFADAAGNSVTVPQMVKINFDATPQAPVLADVNAQCSTTVDEPTVYDPCADVTITGTTTDATSFDAFGTYTIEWTFDYGNGVTTSATQTVNITDTEAPVPNEIETITAECGIAVSAPLAIDECEGQITATTSDATEFNTPGEYNITWVFTDAAGNTAVRTQTVIVTSVPLKLPIVDDLFAACSITADPIHATDPCTGEVITATTNDSLTYDAQGSYTITWNFTYNGQMLSVDQNVVILDNVAPLTVALEDVVSACETTLAAPVTTDNCDGEITATTTDATTFDTPGTYTVNWTFTDAAGNSTTVTQNVIIDPAVLPEPTPLEAVIAECSITLTAPAQNDGCSEELITATTEDPITYDQVGTYTVNWTFAFSSGSVTLAQTVTITDTQAPVAPQLEDVTAYCQTTLAAAFANDACQGTVEGTTATTFFGTPGTYEVIWTFTDDQGNSSTATQMVTILESTPAQVTAVAECNNDISAMVDLALLLPEGMPQGGVWTDVDMTGGLQQDIFVPFGLAVGTYNFQYQVTSDDCVLTVNAMINVGDDCAVLPCESLRVRNAITPNNDGDNDVMIIEGIDASCYAENSIEIFNRWGVLVYEARNYDNTNVVFRGQSEGRATMQKGEDLPAGTYFYVLRYASEDGTYGEKSSYLYISR